MPTAPDPRCLPTAQRSDRDTLVLATANPEERTPRNPTRPSFLGESARVPRSACGDACSTRARMRVRVRVVFASKTGGVCAPVLACTPPGFSEPTGLENRLPAHACSRCRAVRVCCSAPLLRTVVTRRAVRASKHLRCYCHFIRHAPTGGVLRSPTRTHGRSPPKRGCVSIPSEAQLRVHSPSSIRTASGRAESARVTCLPSWCQTTSGRIMDSARAPAISP